jgi:uncharacterized membrane protein
LYVIGLVYLVIQPAVQTRSLSQALIGGLLFGLVAYGTYDFTNLATLKNWPIALSFIDLIWGTTLTTLVSGLTYYIARNINL